MSCGDSSLSPSNNRRNNNERDNTSVDRRKDFNIDNSTDTVEEEIIPETYDDLPKDNPRQNRIITNDSDNLLDSLRRENNRLILEISNAKKEILNFTNNNYNHTLDYNNYTYNCRGCAEIFLQTAKTKENLHGLTTSQFYHDFYNPDKIPISFAKRIDYMCKNSAAYLGRLYRINWSQVDSVINNKEVKEQSLFDKKL